ncbi:hypothetical protein Cni_G04909 [Canna indica]|uniref:Uncharacterized protein n=1 Tax=Canna indica TaxID=4628 RepID=A0AAQ3Q4X7_9LILI|nr:hypothetical protein Cni_G04909 [Canna indica]
MERERERVRAREASSPSPVGFRSWVLLLLFSILLLLFFPLSFRGSRPFAVRNGWDVLNLLLVLFAILCGVLSRRSGGDDADGFPRHAASEEWLGFASRRAHVSYSHRPTEDTPAADVIRMRSDSSYPVQIRPDMAALNSGASPASAEWHRYDDAQLYHWRLESGGWERERFADFESKTIAVDKYVLRRSPSPRSRSPPSPPSLPPQPNPRWTEVDGIFESKKPHLSSSPQPPLQPSQRQPRRRRRRTVEKVSENREVHKDEIFGSDNPHPRSPSPPPLTQCPLRRSMEKYREREVGHNATTTDDCRIVRSIFRNLRVAVDEHYVYMNADFLAELKRLSVLMFQKL